MTAPKKNRKPQKPARSSHSELYFRDQQDLREQGLGRQDSVARASLMKTARIGLPGDLLQGGTKAQFRQNSFSRDRQGSIKRAPAGALMSAAAEMLGYRRYIHFSFAAQTYAKSSIGKFAEE